MNIGHFFRALINPPPKHKITMPPDLQAFEEARNELVGKIDAFGAMVRGMRAPHKKTIAISNGKTTRKK